MENCIYFSGANQKLTYEKQEHVISAGIGGKCKLPKGYVSDQANELFSRYELKCLRYSPLAIERMRYGPGKRGSLNINKIDVPDVLALQPLIENSNQDYVCPLGFLFQNQVYILPQIIVVSDIETKNYEVLYLRSTYQAAGNIEESKFHIHAKTFLMSTPKAYKKIDVPYDIKRQFVSIGCYKKTWYICNTIPDFDIDLWSSRIMNKKPLTKVPVDYFGKDMSSLMFRYKRPIELNYLVPTFIHAKNCFNSLAWFRGNKFVRQEILDKFRQCIIDNDGWEAVVQPFNKIQHNISLWLEENIQGHVHVVVIYTEDDKIMAVSILYGKAWGLFELGAGYHGEGFSYAVICDFQNTREIWYDSGSLT